jgi:hypothetical protein
MLPKIIIEYVGTYDEAIHGVSGKRHTQLAHRGGQLFARRLRKAVSPLLDKMLLTMETETGLSWKWPVIRCYVVHDIPFDFDNPMTIKVRKNMHDATETFFHELVHQLEMQNRGRINMKNDIHMKYKREPKDTLDHVFSHAVLWKVYEKVYGKKRLQRIINGYKLWPDHYKGWQIVKREGPNSILKAYIRPATPLNAIKSSIEHRLAENQIAQKKNMAGHSGHKEKLVKRHFRK